MEFKGSEEETYSLATAYEGEILGGYNEHICRIGEGPVEAIRALPTDILSLSYPYRACSTGSWGYTSYGEGDWVGEYYHAAGNDDRE